MEYSVVIRTLGTAGEKYDRLINSIREQSCQPIEIIVVLPKGYIINKVFGDEKIIYSEKGMVNQRAAGINEAKSEYLLIVDDDICFNSSFVDDIIKCYEKTKADVIVPSYNTFGQNSTVLKSIILNFKYAFIGQRFLMFGSKYRVKYAPTGGHFINLNIKEDRFYLTESWNGACFFLKNDLAKRVKFEQENWLGYVGYEIFEDMVFSNKCYGLGIKAVYAPMIKYVHLDGGTAQQKQITNEKRIAKKLYGNTFNRTVYWYKFLFLKSSMLRKIWLIFWYMYSILNTFSLYLIYALPRFSYWKTPFNVFKAAFDALNFCKKNKLDWI
ncbi:MAG: glycosyltransferase [Paludibacter sp.]|jgi:glycosyltransferase involved in cell wall biosynthesis|nr:glycosyltransferase [Paludibacter sp.]